MLILVVHLTVKAGHAHDVIENFRHLEAESRKEPGCVFYVAQQNTEDPLRFMVYEQYRDEAAIEAHRESAHFKRYAAEGLYRFVEQREATVYRPV